MSPRAKQYLEHAIMYLAYHKEHGTKADLQAIAILKNLLDSQHAIPGAILLVYTSGNLFTLTSPKEDEMTYKHLLNILDGMNPAQLDCVVNIEIAGLSFVVYPKDLLCGDATLEFYDEPRMKG